MKESRDTNNNNTSSVTKIIVGTPTSSCLHITLEAELQDRFSFLLERNAVSERSFLTDILSNDGSFYKSS